MNDRKIGSIRGAYDPIQESISLEYRGGIIIAYTLAPELSSSIGVFGSKPASLRVSVNAALNASAFCLLSSSSLTGSVGNTRTSFVYASIAFDGDNRSLPMRIATSLYAESAM
jgi:hypothetical protein